MYRVTVRLDKRSYPVIIGAGLITQTGKLLHTILPRKCRIAVVTDHNVGRLYSKRMTYSLKQSGFITTTITLPAGERSKSLKILKHLYHEFLLSRLERSSAVLGLGGGVMGDIAGFAAATFMRGISLIQIPTSLLAQVDSSVGGKVAINLPEGKNLVGAFYQPRMVLIDPTVFKTLPQVEFINGMAEVIKIAIIRSPRLVRLLQKHSSKILQHQIPHLEKMIYQAVSLKAQIVEQDEREKNLRMILNYGHTIGHIIENSGRYRRYRHGEAVAIGMNCAALIASQMKLVNPAFVRQQRVLLQQYGLPFNLDGRIKSETILSKLRFDKKVRNGKIRFVLPRGMGRTIISDKVTEELIRIL